MKICHLTSVHPRYDVRIFEKECISLSKAGYEVNLVVADGKGYEEKNGIKIYDVGKPSGRKERMLKTTKKVYQKALELDCDIYHFHDPELLPTGVKLARKGKKTIYDAHEDLPRQIMSKPYLPKIIQKSIIPIVEFYENSKAKKISCIITATDHIKERFKKINTNTEAVKNYPIIDFFDTQVKWEDRKNEICYIGGINYSRGITFLVDAIEKTDTKLHLAGNFHSKELEEQVKNKSGWQKVIFYGFVNKEKVREILNTVKIGMVPHIPGKIQDGLPVKMFEYMAAGIPVIAANFTIWKKILEQNNCGICLNPEQPEEIALAIDKLLGDDKLAKEMGENGKKAVKEKYNWKQEEKKLFNIYKKL
jgi:glycosyltransferase involved in cell wall biosynthesis